MEWLGELLNMPSFFSVIENLRFEGTNVKMAREIEAKENVGKHFCHLIADCQEPIAEGKNPKYESIMSARQAFECGSSQCLMRTQAEVSQLLKCLLAKGSVKLVDKINVAAAGSDY